MKALLWGMLALVGPLAGQAGEPDSRVEYLTNRMPWGSDPIVRSAPAVSPAPATRTTPTPNFRERFFDFATKPRFPRWPFQPEDRLRPTTLGLRTELRDGLVVLATPVGLGMSPAEARTWLASLSDAVLTNLELFEFSYRAALVPQELGGPGLTFAEAHQAAFKLALAGRAWSLAPDTHSRLPVEPPWETGAPWPGGGFFPFASPFGWPGWPWYEYPSTAHPPASFSEQTPRIRWDKLIPDAANFPSLPPPPPSFPRLPVSR
jgi:hypothetical protein